MKNYSEYTAVDFAMDEDFIFWVETGANDDTWQAWLIEHPGQEEAVNEAISMIRAVENDEKYILSSIKNKDLWGRIEGSVQASKKKELRSKWKKSGVLIGILMFLMVSVVGIYYFNFNSPANGDLLSYKNESNQPHKLVLSDGSIVTLKPHSSLEYPESFSANSREVHLYGEAFFQVKRNPQKPFSVYSEDIVTKVLGTSFNVQAFEEKKDIVVSVKTGKVSVATKVEYKRQTADPSEQLKGVLITRNQQITFSKKNRKMTKQLVSEPVLRNAKPGAFTFEDKPVAEIFHKLERAYGIDIIFDKEVMAQCRLTTKLDNTEFYDKLRLICKGLNAKYEILDAHVIISGDGCQ